MKVRDSIKINDRHYIEWGDATWTEQQNLENKDFSIRNRLDKENGGYNHTGSKELPWWDFNTMILENIRRGHLSNNELSKILNAIAEKLNKTD